MNDTSNNFEKRMGLRSGTVFWGVFLIFIGLYFLLRNFGVSHWPVDVFLNLWPLAIIFWGVSILKIPYIYKRILAGVSAALIALFLIALISTGWRWMDRIFVGPKVSVEYNSDDPDPALRKSDLIQMDTSYKEAYFKFSGGAGEFDFSDFDSNLIEINGYGELGTLDFKLASDSVADIHYNMDDNDETINISERRRQLYFNRGVEWHIDINVGACDLNCDFSQLAVRDMEIDAGAADIDVRLGGLAESANVSVETGVSDVLIEVPESIGCEIRRKTGFSSTTFEGFEMAGKGVYRSPNFHSSDKKIYIQLKGGMSNFEVSFY